MRERDPLNGPLRAPHAAASVGLVLASVALATVLVAGCAEPESRPRQPLLIEGSGEHRPKPLIAARELVSARRSARTFVRAYLRVAFGGAAPAALRPLSGRLRRRPELIVPRPTPTRKLPQIRGIEVVAQAPDLVLAIATLRAGRGAGYPFAFNLARRSGRWVVTIVGAD